MANSDVQGVYLTYLKLSMTDLYLKITGYLLMLVSILVYFYERGTQRIFVRANDNAEKIWPHHRFPFIVHFHA